MTDGFFSSPEELVNHLRSHHQQVAMTHEDRSHMIRDLLHDLDKDQLDVLAILVRAAQDELTRGHILGRIMAEKDHRYGVCPCGNYHDKLPEDMQPHADPVPDELAAASQQLVRDNVFGEKPEPIPTTVEELMNIYSIEPHPDFEMEDWGKRYETRPAPFRCSNCGMNYQSLEDRMAREPGIGGCSGCKIKSAHG